jgi:hypothetical protein
MTQTDKILELISAIHPAGAKAELARITGKNRSQVTRWSLSGYVSPSAYPALMDWAAEHEVEDEMLAIIGYRLPSGVYIRATGW